MATLDSLRDEFSKLSDMELLARINEIRRRRVATPEKVKQNAKKEKKTEEEKILAALKNLPAELRESILKEL